MMRRSPIPTPDQLEACSHVPAPTTAGGCLPCPEERSPETDSACLRCAIRSGQPFFLGRPGMGGPEDAACFESMGGKVNNESSIWRHVVTVLASLNGVKTHDFADAKAYARCYTAAINATDLIVRLGDNMPLRLPLNACSRPGQKHFHKTDVLLHHAGHLYPRRLIGGGTLNPWEALTYGQITANRTATRRLLAWTRALRGKTVLVVHPFTATIAAQLARGNVALWGEYAEDVMPSGIHFKLAQAPQNLGNLTEQSSWREAYVELVRRVETSGRFDLAVIACGGLGMLLGAHLRASNRAAMYMGGALQLWFGIIGKRWANAFMPRTNGNWSRPLSVDVPHTAFRTKAKSGDGSAYW